MKLIELTQGYETQVSDEDYDWLIKHKWHINKHKKHDKCYAVTRIGKKKIKMHRMIMNITDPKIFIDHIDRNSLNNQRENLRTATISQSNANRRTKRPNQGVYHISYYNAICTKDGKSYRKYCKTEQEAILWYNNKTKELHGEYAVLNEIK